MPWLIMPKWLRVQIRGGAEWLWLGRRTAVGGGGCSWEGDLGCCFCPILVTAVMTPADCRSVVFSSVAQSCLTLCDPMASLSFTNSQSLLRLMSIELVMPSKHLILCHPLLPSVLPSIRVSSNESVLCINWPEYWSFSISPSSEYSGLIS